MNYFMSEQDALAIIDERIDDIVAKMASGSSANESQLNSSGGGAGGAPCNGTCVGDPPATICCNCCVC